VSELERIYESATGEKALYRKGSSDYHTLRYVRWLEEMCRPPAIDREPPCPTMRSVRVYSINDAWYNAKKPYACGYHKEAACKASPPAIDRDTITRIADEIADKGVCVARFGTMICSPWFVETAQALRAALSDSPQEGRPPFDGQLNLYPAEQDTPEGDTNDT